jgi:hypothetical protein
MLLAGLLLLAACASGPPPPPPPIIGSFGDFTPPAQPHYLACPQDYCLVRPDEVTPLLHLPADRLREIVRGTIDAQPQAKLMATSNEGLRLVYRRSDEDDASIVTIDVVDADEGVSALAVYSQSETGEREADYAIVRRLVDAIVTKATSSAAR